MPLRPEGAQLLVIRSSDGAVLYEGDGQVQVGLDPAVIPGVNEPRTDRESARGFVLHVDVDQVTEEHRRTWGEMVQSMTEQAAQTRALDGAVRYLLEAYGLGPEILSPPVHRRAYWEPLSDLAQETEVTRPDIEDLQRVVEERFWTGAVRAEHALEEFQRAVGSGPVPEYDELVDSTRAEFPYDPLDYGRLGREQMTWSPPEDGQEVSRCP